MEQPWPPGGSGKFQSGCSTHSLAALLVFALAESHWPGASDAAADADDDDGKVVTAMMVGIVVTSMALPDRNLRFTV